jgi:hypothetical protein
LLLDLVTNSKHLILNFKPPLKGGFFCAMKYLVSNQLYFDISPNKVITPIANPDRGVTKYSKILLGFAGKTSSKKTDKVTQIKILLLALIVCFYFNGKSQTQPSIFTLKPAIGINGCQVHGDSYSGYNKLGVFAGLAVNAKLKEKTSFELGFYFSQKGARHNPNFKTGDYSSYNLNLYYVDLPLSLRYQATKSYFLTAGLSFAYLITYKEEILNADMSKYSRFEKTETGLNFGIGKQLKKGFSIEVRSCNSITSVRRYGIAATGVYYNNPIARFFNKGFYNNLLTIFAAYQLSQKKHDAEPKN